MAKIGLKGFWCGKYAEDATAKTVTITAGKKVGKAVSFNPTATVNEATIYGDNSLDSKVRAISSFGLEVTPVDINDDVNELTGIAEETITVNGSEVSVTTYKTNNQGTNTAVGIIISKIESNVKKYIVEIYPKTVFTPSTDEALSTQGESISFSTSPISGTAYADVNGNFKWVKSFDTEAEAETFLNTTFSVA